MGTIAARDAMRVCELTERVAAIGLLACCQALDVRGSSSLHPRSMTALAAVRQLVPVNTADRRQDWDIVAVVDALAAGGLQLGEWEEP
jgi:histidine ammonia-lyase/phenylalanine ammonia-lyase